MIIVGGGRQEQHISFQSVKGSCKCLCSGTVKLQLIICLKLYSFDVTSTHALSKIYLSQSFQSGFWLNFDQHLEQNPKVGLAIWLRMGDNLQELILNALTYPKQHCNCINLHIQNKILSYLIFVISFTQTGFSKTKFYTQKSPKTLKMSLKKSYICIFFTHSGKIYT